MQVLVQRRHHVRLLTYAQVSKEAYSYGERGLFIWQKRPINMLCSTYPRQRYTKFVSRKEQ